MFGGAAHIRDLLCGCCQDSYSISTAAGWSFFSASRACLLKAPGVAPQGTNSERRQQRHYDRQLRLADVWLLVVSEERIEQERIAQESQQPGTLQIRFQDSQ